MSGQSIKPGKILENFQSLVHPGDSKSPLMDPEDNTPTFNGQGGESKYSKENPETRRLTQNAVRPLSQFWRH